MRTLGFDSREALLASAPADLLGAYEIFDEAGRPYPIAELPGRRALAGEEAPEAIVRFRVRATGEERWSAVKANPIRDDDGRVSMAINVIEDITAHKRAELAQRFLSRSTAVLSGWLGSDELLTQVARLAVPRWRTGCSSTSWASWAWSGSRSALRSGSLRAPRRWSCAAAPTAGRWAAANVLRTGRAGLFHPDCRRAGGGRRRAPRSIPRSLREFRHALGDRGPDDRPRPHARRTDLGVRRRRASLRPERPRGWPRSSRAAARSRSTTPGSSPSGPTSLGPSSRACSRPSCRTSRASRPPRAFGPSARATRWAATSTTSSRPASAAGRS